MRKRFILYKIIQVPAGGDAISYLREIKYGMPYFTTLKRDATRFSFVKAIYYSLRFSLSTLPERLA
jgi:hypothetical protein